MKENKCVHIHGHLNSGYCTKCGYGSYALCDRVEERLARKWLMNALRMEEREFARGTGAMYGRAYWCSMFCFRDIFVQVSVFMAILLTILCTRTSEMTMKLYSSVSGRVEESIVWSRYYHWNFSRRWAISVADFSIQRQAHCMSHRSDLTVRSLLTRRASTQPRSGPPRKKRIHSFHFHYSFSCLLIVRRFRYTSSRSTRSISIRIVRRFPLIPRKRIHFTISTLFLYWTYVVSASELGRIGEGVFLDQEIKIESIFCL